MKTSASLEHDYLSAVEREASALPADRRQELLADLAEHIEVTRAERPGAAIGEILAELGDPRAIATTALAEAENGAAGAPARSRAGASARPGLLFRITGAILLRTSVHWAAVQKTTGLLLAAVLPIAVTATANLSGDGPAVGTPALLANLAMLALIAATAAWLWRVRRA